tara:strand:+ start:2005 stop:2295 length:291 start_codon:yes stop_codon:yes gene_type:complete
MTEERVSMIERRLTEAFDPTELQVKDQSHLHAGHAGAEGGMGHYAVHIVSDHFTGMPSIARHRAIYEALGTLLETDIHAVKIKAFSTSEIRKSSTE